jgi:alpha-glucosidase
MITKTISTFIFLVVFTFIGVSQNHSIYSPDKKSKIDIFMGQDIKINVYHDNQLLIANLLVNLDIAKEKIKLSKYKVENEAQISVIIDDPVPVKFAAQEVEYSQLILKISKQVKWELMVSNDGFAYRWLLDYPNEIQVKEEKMQFQMNPNDISYFPKEESMVSHYERLYIKTKLDTMHQGDFCSLPVLFKKENGFNILFTEADLYNYPALFLQKEKDNGVMHAIFPKVILEVKEKEKGPDRNQVITKEADYIAAIISGKANLPWRIFGLSETDKDLVINNMVYQLSSPLKLKNIEWIKPGKVAWDWWNDNNIIGLDFESGINNDTYKYYIDFASKYGLDYIILDEGWSKSTTEIMAYQKNIDVEELVKYGEQKNVGIILWTLWGPLDKDLNKVLELYQSWGVKGIKVDFMQRADQYMVEYYERVAIAAAKYQLLVDFHGAFKPAGLRRAYPNVINYEGLKGQENVKWADYMTPQHNTTLPFIRMVAGPMDYTPGAMDNAHFENFSIRWHRPMSIGTRCHQVAMYVIYESPLQMLCDNPSNYYREHETTEFISQIPTTWDETIVLEAKIGEYILMARRDGDTWYIGGMTVDAQEFQVDLRFLNTQDYQMAFMQDGINSDKNAQDYHLGSKTVSNKTKITVKMNKGGGFAAILNGK